MSLESGVILDPNLVTSLTQLLCWPVQVMEQDILHSVLPSLSGWRNGMPKRSKDYLFFIRLILCKSKIADTWRIVLTLLSFILSLILDCG